MNFQIKIFETSNILKHELNIWKNCFKKNAKAKKFDFSVTF